VNSQEAEKARREATMEEAKVTLASKEETEKTNEGLLKAATADVERHNELKW